MKQLKCKKIGIQLLEENQLRTTFPELDLLRKKIDTIRERANNKVAVKKNEPYIQYNLMYDHVFSIVGERGTGKTSTLFTIYHQMLNRQPEAKKDVYIPMIIPELMNSGDTLIGWILVSLEAVVDELESMLKEVGCAPSTDSLYYKNCVFNKDNELKRKYRELKEEYLVIQTMGADNRGSYIDKVHIEQDRIQTSYQFLNKLKDFWDLLIKTKKQINKEAANCSEEPLIYVFIDDADLVPQILNELMYTITKYLSHPNIVVIVTLSPSVMRFSIENKLYRSIIGKPLDMFNYPTREQGIAYDVIDGERKNQAIDITNMIDFTKSTRYYKNVSKLSHDMLMKVFAPANRFYVREFITLEQKNDFIVQMVDDNNSPKAYTLRSFLQNQIKLLCERGAVMTNEKKSILERVPEMYLSFFGKTAREISNVCLAINNMCNKFCELEYFCEPDRSDQEYRIDLFYDVLFDLLSLIIDSNQDYKCLVRRRHRLFMKHYNGWELYVNYGELNNIFCEDEYREMNITENLNVFVSMYAMLHFIENIVCIIIPSRNKTHGYNELATLLFDECNCKHIVPKEDLHDMLQKIGVFYDKDIIRDFQIEKVTHQDVFIRSFWENRKDNEDNEVNVDKLIEEIKEYIKKDSEWGAYMCAVLYRRFSGCWLFDNLTSYHCNLKQKVYADELMKKINNHMQYSLEMIIKNNTNYVSWIKDKLSKDFKKKDNKNVNAGEQYDVCNEIYIKVKNRVNKNDFVMTFDEILKITEQYKTEEKIMCWMEEKKISRTDILKVFDTLRGIIYRYGKTSESDGTFHPYKLKIKDARKFRRGLHSLYGYTSYLDTQISKLIKYVYQGSEILQNQTDEKHTHSKRRPKTGSNPKTSLINLETFEKFFMDAEKILSLFERNKKYVLYNLLDECNMAIYVNDSAIKQSIDYVMALNAVEFLYEFYIAETLNLRLQKDTIHKSDWEKRGMEDVYKKIIDKYYVVDEWIFEKISHEIGEEQNKIYDAIRKR